MDPVITMQCGPIRHEIEDASTFAKHLVVHPTVFTTDEPGNDGASFQAIYTELAHHADRNAQIATDIADATARGRCSLALTNRVEHIHQLAAALKPHGVEPLMLHGGLPPAERARIRAVLAEETTKPLVLLAIDKLVGEGFDQPRLDTLFLTSPASFKGRVIQKPVPAARTSDVTTTHLSVPAVAEVRAWARRQDLDVPPRGRLRQEIWDAWHAAHPEQRHGASPHA
ncbi:Lsr2 family DNA-binding protein [Streptomyces halobius]|uniref:Lsr2 DNA-binding domain-containing protein n=1 Tax=Streptomyces halobius TaxID=2879846 RepID=A0ABY4M048_9ACTN|nr:hypothetical protein [Streptomyces halobius]UQA91130.1 hypothetical protein K9S39_03825 [Streptomyces halobius]